jgi:DnaJ-class molecular chaperone
MARMGDVLIGALQELEQANNVVLIGRDPSGIASPCPVCHGYGYMFRENFYMEDKTTKVEICEICRGAGSEA